MWMTDDQRATPMTDAEAQDFADQLVTWAGTLAPRPRQALGEILVRAATAPLGGDALLRPRVPLLPDSTYDRFFVRLGERAPDLTIPEA